MKRPGSLTCIAIGHLLIGLAWLFAFLGLAFLFRESTNPSPWGWDDLLFFAWDLAWAGLFLAIGYGLFRLRKWARMLTIALDLIVSVSLAADFIISSSSVPSDRIGQLESLVMASRLILQLPFFLVSWPLWEGASYFYPDSKSSLLFAGVNAIGMASILGYAGVVRYMFTHRVKQAFARA